MPGPALAELIRPCRTALLLQEVQDGVVGEEAVLPELAATAAEAGLVPNAARLAVAAREAGVRVIHAISQDVPDGFGVNRNARLFATCRKACAGNGSGAPVRPAPEVFADGDLVLSRYHGLSPMADGQLDALLRNTGITSIVVTGVSLNVAIPNLVFDAVNRSYQVVVPADAVAGTPPGFGDEILAHSIALVATLATTDDLVEAWYCASRQVGA
ncbi:MAG: isochorismatase family protein [Nocardiopsaceae bacterium]|nr:isochorismatase family protein [Nocardiopsaceae bacterium]